MKNWLDKYEDGGDLGDKYVDPEHTPSYRKVDTFINGLQDAVMNNPIVGPQVRGLAGLASGAYNLLETGIGKLYENKSQKEKEELFQKYRPIEYPSFGTAVARTVNKNVKPRMDDKGNYALEEEAWRKAMDLPVKSNYIRESKYKPTSAKDPNAKYYTLHPNVIDKQKLIDYANSDAWEKNKRMSKSGKEYLQMSSFAPFMNQEFLDRQSLEENQSAKDIDPLQRFQLYKGYDPKKKKNYVSISDKYDFDFKPAKAVTKPYDIYDRFYYEDGGKVQENYNDYSVSAPEGFVGDGYNNVGRNYSPAWGGQFKEGGELPNVTVKGKKKQPIYVTNPNDPRLKAYNDSLALYKQGEKKYKERLEFNKKNNIPKSSTRKWNNPVEYHVVNKKGDIELNKIQPIEGNGYLYNYDPDNVSGTNVPSSLTDNYGFRYKKPTQLIEYINRVKQTETPELQDLQGGLPVDISLPELYRQAGPNRITMGKPLFKGGPQTDYYTPIDEAGNVVQSNDFKTNQFQMGGSLPGAVGFTYARTQSPAPSNGKYAKKTKASAQNGTEMRYYQEGLDWKPKTISRDGSQLVKLDQLTNFTNYNTKQPGGWLDKYEG